MNLEELRELIDYHYWARDRILAAVESLSPEEFTRDLGNSFGSIRDTLTHIYSAEWIWCARWHGELPKAMLPGDAFSDVTAIREAWIGHEAKLRSFIERLGAEGVGGMIEYRTMQGKVSSSVFWKMLQHVVNHASYHRGQITTMLRQLGANPPASMDMIAFYRERDR